MAQPCLWGAYAAPDDLHSEGCQSNLISTVRDGNEMSTGRQSVMIASASQFHHNCSAAVCLMPPIRTQILANYSSYLYATALYFPLTKESN